MVSFSTNYYKSQFFEALVTVNLTSLLVLTTLFISVANALPQTSYIKMIDMWLIYSLTTPYFQVILHTAIAALRYEDEGILLTYHNFIIEEKVFLFNPII